MDKKRASGVKQFFPRIIVTTTMKNVVPDMDRDAVVFVNGGDTTVYAGMTGVPIANWMPIPAGQGFVDNYSRDNWWVLVTSGSGSVGGFIVQGG